MKPEECVHMECEKCTWWEKVSERAPRESEGVCRRYPPVMDGNENRYTVTDSYEWCGEFEQKENE